MKKLFVLCAVMLFAANLFGQGITGSKHDFSSAGWNSTGQICVVCHTPHNAMGGYTPLWNHQVTSATFTPYSSPSLDATDLGQPNGISKLCLSCHDGTVGLEAFGGVTTNLNPITGSSRVGTDLSNDHPVSFTYNTALATSDGGLFDPSTRSSGLGGTINADLLRSNKMECSSCHDVHNKYGVAKLLKKSNAGSALCLTCHNK